MFNGDFTVQDADMNDPIALARLGVEARSILKSIQTEDAKLQSSSHPTRSDLHYFRARFNYYRLSLLRLQIEEKATLEPILAKFLHRIVAFEGEMGAGEPGITPFLTTVDRATPQRPVERQISAPVNQVSPISQASQGSQNSVSYSAAGSSRTSRASNEDLISQLQLVKMALASDIDAHGRRTLADGLERVIQSLRG